MTFLLRLNICKKWFLVAPLWISFFFFYSTLPEIKKNERDYPEESVSEKSEKDKNVYNSGPTKAQISLGLFKTNFDNIGILCKACKTDTVRDISGCDQDSLEDRICLA